MLKQKLIDFETDIESVYQTGAIRGPIHLRGGNEDYLIDIFKRFYKPGDYVFSTWANHLHALLAGIDPERIKDRILEGESMAMNFPEHNFYTSAIVGGILPIAVGVASTLTNGSRVLCFIGDMTFRTGIAHESIMYAISNNLPIMFIVEDNGMSVGTPTEETWGSKTKELVDFYDRISTTNCLVEYYTYKNKYPHSGVGNFVSF